MKGHGIVRDLEYITFSIAGLAGTGGAQRGQRLHLGRGALTDQLLELWVEGALGHGVDARVWACSKQGQRVPTRQNNFQREEKA